MSMVYFRRLGESKRFAFESESCIDAECWRPDLVDNQANGDGIFGCATCESIGCPDRHKRNLDKAVGAKRRKTEGWLLVQSPKK